jgi:hypothetical protein
MGGEGPDLLAPGSMPRPFQPGIIVWAMSISVPANPTRAATPPTRYIRCQLRSGAVGQ